MTLFISWLTTPFTFGISRWTVPPPPSWDIIPGNLAPLGPANKNPWCLFKVGLSSWFGFVFNHLIKWIFSILQVFSWVFSWDMMYTYSFYDEALPPGWNFRPLIIDLFATATQRVDVIAKDLGKLGAKKQEATDLPGISNSFASSVLTGWHHINTLNDSGLFDCYKWDG